MNLDFEAAKLSQEIISKTIDFKSSDVENLVTKTLGVLQENGVYACMLYLLSRDNEMARCVVCDCPNVNQKRSCLSRDNEMARCVVCDCPNVNQKRSCLPRDNEMARCVVNSLLKMVELIEIKLPVTSSTKNEDILISISNSICNDLDTLFLTKQLWEQILLYARYGAKAAKERRQ